MEYIDNPSLSFRITEFSYPDIVFYIIRVGDEDLGRFDNKEDVLQFIEKLLQGKRLMMPPRIRDDIGGRK